MKRWLRINLLGPGPRFIKKKEFTGPSFYKKKNLPGPRFIKKRIYRAAVSQRLRNTALGYWCFENYNIVMSWFNHFCFPSYLPSKFSNAGGCFIILHAYTTATTRDVIEKYILYHNCPYRL
jgi:hypothetical protein